MSNCDGIDLYKILNVNRNCNKNDIKKSFNKLVLKHHPDRGGNDEIYEIILNAYNILINDDTRKQYDILYESENEQSNYYDMKQKSHNYMTKQSNSTIDRNKFNEQWEQLNKKHGYYEDTEKINVKQNFSELKVNRERHYNEDKPENLFTDIQYNPNRFNAAFEASNGRITDIIEKKDVPDAWNSSSIISYSNINDLDKLYDDNEKNTNGKYYGSINFDRKSKKISSKDIKNLNNYDLYTNHNKIDKDYYDSVKDKLKNRNLDTEIYNNNKMHQYDKNNTAGYGIFDKLGINFDNLKLI